MTAYFIFIRDKTTDAAELATYGQKAGATIAGHAATPLAFYGKHEVLEGPDVEGVVVIAFPSIEEGKAWYNSDGYKAAREHRFRGAEYRLVAVEGL